MPRFFVKAENVSPDSVVIKGDDAFHIARSLRMAVGDTVTVCDGEKTEYLCRLDSIRDNECVSTVLEKKRAGGEPPVEVTLYMAYPKGDKMETVVQKAVELGARAIVPFESERCIKRPSGDKVEKITVRLARIAEEAAKQCGRGILPSVSSILKFGEMTEAIKRHSLTLFCYEDEKGLSVKSALKAHPDVQSIAVIVGSEGGFSPAEAEKIKGCGAHSVTLGPRILRCETAPDYVLSAISYEFELD